MAEVYQRVSKTDRYLRGNPTEADLGRKVKLASFFRTEMPEGQLHGYNLSEEGGHLTAVKIDGAWYSVQNDQAALTFEENDEPVTVFYRDGEWQASDGTKVCQKHAHPEPCPECEGAPIAPLHVQHSWAVTHGTECTCGCGSDFRSER
jgi:hypothetical protein